MTLKIKNFSKRYDDNWVIKEVSFEIEGGEILGIFGVVGVGKSTLIKAIAGSENHDDGTVFFDTEDFSALTCEERAFNFPNLTNESFWKTIFKTNKPSELSDGEGQALALDIALENSSNVLLLDNQFCFMDRQLKEKKAEQLKKAVSEKNLSVVFATNDY
jgi:ABC-type Fe3+/spermidine/putrescine transport system ATPase subunit